MSSTLASILVNISTAAGPSAIDYTPGATVCPILGFNCISASGTGSVKLTPLNSTNFSIVGSTSGTGARLRIVTGGAGNITSVEIANGGSGYVNGPVPVTISDPYGSGGVIMCTAAGGSVTAVSISSQGSGYSGYITMDISDFIEGVVYNIVPRYIEQTSGAGTLSLIGYKLPFRPFQIF